MLQWVYERLFAAYGPQHWWPGESPFEVCVGAILTQAVSWRNVEAALAALRAAGLFSLEAIAGATDADLYGPLRPARYARRKAQTLRAFCLLVQHRFGGDLEAFLRRPAETVRRELLAVHGIGPETADSILLYAGGHPVFVVDAYTERLLVRLGAAAPPLTYGAMQRMFMEALPADPALYNEYHALIVRHGKDTCTARDPRCGACPLAERCRTGRMVNERKGDG